MRLHSGPDTRDEDAAQLVECLSSWLEALGSIAASGSVYICSQLSGGGRAEGSGVQGHPQLCSKFEASLDYM